MILPIEEELSKAIVITDYDTLISLMSGEYLNPHSPILPFLNRAIYSPMLPFLNRAIYSPLLPFLNRAIYADRSVSA